jgi:hypothetical protein
MSDRQLGLDFKQARYEGNAAFQIGKDGETEERHERRFRFLNVVMGCYTGFSVYQREADGPMGMH